MEEARNAEDLVHALESKGQYKKAAILALEAGMTDRGIDILEKAGELREAAHYALEAGMTERADGLYKRIIDHCKSSRGSAQTDRFLRFQDKGVASMERCWEVARSYDYEDNFEGKVIDDLRKRGWNKDADYFAAMLRR